MEIYNTLTKKEEEFIPHNDGEVSMYTCGPTVYHYAHIGNLRCYIFEDIFEKGLNYLGYKVKRVMNITDVGHNAGDADIGLDKMVESAKREHKSAQEIASFYTKCFREDFNNLNLKWPEIVEKATDHINDYIEAIKVLLDKGYAYQSGGNIYFDITRANEYFKLSGKKAEDLIVGVRDSVTKDELKKNPFDFGLWFTKSKFDDQEQKWNSPWGIGYPGWHIECSIIASKYLGEYLDIHCGGVDNIFPHHTNEIAQSEALFGHKWCNYWVHSNHLNDKSGKMSKSKGDFLTLDLLKAKDYNPLSYKYMCLNSHYRNNLVFSYESLDIAQNTYFKLKKRILSLNKNDGEYDDELAKKYFVKFEDAIANDLNTAMMLTTIYDLLKDDELNECTKLTVIEDFDKVLGLDLTKEEEFNVDEEILNKIKERDIAKANKDYKKADEIRDELLQKGIKLIDTNEGTKYERG